MKEVETNPDLDAQIKGMKPGSMEYKDAIAKRDRFKTCQCAQIGAFTPDKAFEDEAGNVTLLTEAEENVILVHTGETTGNQYRLSMALGKDMLDAIVELATTEKANPPEVVPESENPVAEPA